MAILDEGLAQSRTAAPDRRSVEDHIDECAKAAAAWLVNVYFPGLGTGERADVAIAVINAYAQIFTARAS